MKYPNANSQILKSSNPHPQDGIYLVTLKRPKCSLYQQVQRIEEQGADHTVFQETINNFYKLSQDSSAIATKELYSVYEKHIFPNEFQDEEFSRALFSHHVHMDHIKQTQRRITIAALAYVKTFFKEPTFNHIEDLKSWARHALVWIYGRMNSPLKCEFFFFIKLVGNLLFAGHGGAEKEGRLHRIIREIIDTFFPPVHTNQIQPEILDEEIIAAVNDSIPPEPLVYDFPLQLLTSEPPQIQTTENQALMVAAPIFNQQYFSLGSYEQIAQLDATGMNISDFDEEFEAFMDEIVDILNSP